MNFHKVWFVFGAVDFELPVFAVLWWNMGQSSVSDGFAETSEAPIDSMVVDKVRLKKAETRISTVKITQVIVFFFISFYPLDILAEAALGGGKASGEATATTRHSLSINL